jgi:hypothetical protein
LRILDYNNNMAPTRWTSSADKHDVDRADTLHAMRSAVIYVKNFDAARVPGRPAADLFIGPSRDGSVMLEVFAHVDQANKDALIFHSMPVRVKTLERARRILAERKGQQ